MHVCAHSAAHHSTHLSFSVLTFPSATPHSTPRTCLFLRIHAHACSYISPGNRLPRGQATIAAVVSYCGQPFQLMHDGVWTTVHGWQGLRTKGFPGLGSRLVARCNVADLGLLPPLYPSLRTLELRAGLEIRAFVLGLHAMSWAGRGGLLSERDNMRLARPILWASNLFAGLGSNDGGMVMTLSGTTPAAPVAAASVEGGDAGGVTAGVPVCLEWSVMAQDGDGPNLPCMPAVAVTRKLAATPGLVSPGARPCVGEITLDDFQREMDRYRVVYRDDRREGGACGAAAGSHGNDGDGVDADTDKRGLLTQALGSEAVAAVPGAMRAFHERCGEVAGVFTITRARGALAALLCKWAGFPRAGTGIETTVTATEAPAVDGGGSLWLRRFDADRMQSLLRYRHGLVEERFLVMGIVPVTFGFHFAWQPLAAGFLPGRPHLEALVGQHGLHHITRKMWVGPDWARVPVPRALMVTADGVSLPRNGGLGWSVDVSVQAPLGAGELLSYSGTVQAEGR